MHRGLHVVLGEVVRTAVQHVRLGEVAAWHIALANTHPVIPDQLARCAPTASRVGTLPTVKNQSLGAAISVDHIEIPRATLLGRA